MPQGEDCDEVVPGEAPHHPDQVAREQPGPESDWECLDLDEVPAPGLHQQEHGGAESWNHQAVDREDGQLIVPEEAGGEHAEEAPGGHWQGGDATKY